MENDVLRYKSLEDKIINNLLRIVNDLNDGVKLFSNVVSRMGH